MPEFQLADDPFLHEATLDSRGQRALGTKLDSWRQELGGYFAEMQEFQNMAPDDVFLRLSAFSARASEIRYEITQTDNRRHQSFRTQGIDPFLEECDRQFRIHSRIQSVRDMEFKLSGGQT